MGARLVDLIAGLTDPRAYPHAVAGLHVVQTHASCVFLTGAFAYKIKKPVNFGFLDYSTLARRRNCCEQEVLLNQRLCPEVYLDVVPVVERDGGLGIGGAGEPVEWAIRMRQLPEADMLPNRLAAGTITGDHPRRIARVLAAFHARAATGPTIRAFGAPRVVAANAEENFTQTEALVGDALPAAHLQAVRAYTSTFLRERSAELRARMAGDRVRDGHGDLRAQNICLWEGLPGGVQIFDCIEFNERFRYQDVAVDLAYLAMDLDLAGRTDLRRELVEHYRAASGDEGLERVLPFYQCYRAYVRGKIALFAAAEREIPARQREADGELAGCAFDLARSYAGLQTRPLLLLMMGLSGSGKSALARELGRRLPAAVVSSDLVRRELAGVPTGKPLGREWYAPARVARIYDELRGRGRESLRRGQHTILDATFLDDAERQAASGMAAACSAAWYVVECCCPEAVARQRIAGRRERGPQASDADLAIYAAQRQRYQPGGESFRRNHITVETNDSPARLARRVLEHLWAPSRAAWSR
jgi:aminoglycoside phosphotransferase family enzyme/predicted kinase